MSTARVIALLGLGLLTACDRTPPINTAIDLANVLRDKGIPFETTEPIDLSGMRFAQIDEGVRLTGSGAHVEILRIEDQRTFEIFSSMGVLLKALNEKLGETPLEPPDVIVRQPFIVVVRREPEPGQVRGIVERVLPGQAS